MSDKVCIINEIGDLGFGADEVSEQDQKKLEKNLDTKKNDREG